IGYAPVYYPGTTSQADAAPITVGPGDERTNIDITARPVPMTRIDGVVIGPDGQPVPGVSIQLRAEDRIETLSSMFASQARAVTSRPDGTFTVTSLAPGRYTLQARQRLPATIPTGPGIPASLPSSSAQGLWASVEISADGQPITGLTLTLQAGMTISGRVVLEGASKQSTVEFPAINVMAAPARPMDLMSLARGAARIDADGTFTITGLIPGTYRLAASSMPTPGQPRGVWMDTSVRLGGREVSDLPFELRPGENITDAVITMTDRQQQLSGTLQDASGRPATDYTMILFPPDRAYWLPDSRRIITARPGTDGRFAFLALQGPPPGEYMIAAVTDLRPSEQFDPDFLAALLPQAFKVTLGPGETKTQDVRLVKVP
ncbi:MAG TPA: carboxypeptidase regulatory-like domain-containing protein, partial [Vicinamibacterales bacterium]